MRENFKAMPINATKGKLGSIRPVISKLKVDTGLFTNDLVNFAYMCFGLPHLRREILAIFATGPFQNNSNTGLLLILRCSRISQASPPMITVYHVFSSYSPAPSQTSFQQPTCVSKP